MKPTPSQTIGPFFAVGLGREDSGGPLKVEGVVLDGAGEPVPDAYVELWDGIHFARSPTDDQGRYSLATEHPDTPFIDVSVFARGLLQRLVTRIYVDDDPLLMGLAERAATLRPVKEGDALRFDIHLQGDRETVFFDL
jgi:protocatechuate 3,4-dioxygenase alpha subunit